MRRPPIPAPPRRPPIKALIALAAFAALAPLAAMAALALATAPALSAATLAAPPPSIEIGGAPGAGGAAKPPAGAGKRPAPGGKRSSAPLSAAEVQQASRRLAELGYWPGAAEGRWDAVWRQALLAFQKMEWRKRTGVLTRADWSELLRAEPPAPRETGPAHLEVDLARQVFYMVDAEGKVSHILPVSSGTGKPFRAPGWRGTADTPCGHFTVFSRLSGWRKSPLGVMYNPLYLVGGIAIHGSLDVPPVPASHGCIRIPMFASRRLPQMVPRETPVLVYGCRDEPPGPPLPAVARTSQGSH
ncbi:MAG TPA: L,D-transpeptidase family protein [Thermoanaerobaculia bacterium]|nr:L,D-transpeptidase family protein [Thermoanaerobaculia bacterium]